MRESEGVAVGPGTSSDRSRFLQALDAHLSRDEAGIAVLRIDLDRFSRIRQVFGPTVAHMVRQLVLQRIERMTGDPLDMLALAEDSFIAVVRMREGLEDGETIGRVAVESVSAPVHVEGLPAIAVGSNVGIALGSDFSPADPLRLMAGAELAVQRANAIGSRRIIVYRVEPVDDPTRIPELFADMFGAIEGRQFVAFYQPVFVPTTGQVVGAEALIRWDHPKHGLLLPRDFIAEAERSGLIRDIDGLMWQQSWSFLAAMPASEQLDLGVNLSVADLDFPDLLDKVKRLVDETGVDVRRLVFEVTETAMSQDWDRAHVRLAELRDFGCRVAIDDFGSGHMYLDRLNTGLFDFLKLDRALTWGATEKAGRDLLQGVTSLGHSLGIRVLAEGVETEEQFNVVSEVGVDLAQGFWFGRPMAADDFRSTHLYGTN